MKINHTVTVSGYYGFGNLGDEAVLRSILRGIGRELPGTRVFVLCERGAELPEAEGVCAVAVSRADPVAIISSLCRSQLFISGGGSLLQDTTSSKSLAYYCTLIRLARLLGCKVLLLANGIGPVKNTKACKKALCACHLISVRDSDSYSLAGSLTEGRVRIVQTADPIFSHSFSRERVGIPSFASSGRPFFAMSLRPLANKKRPDTAALCDFIFSCKDEGLLPVFVPMQESFDLELCLEMAEKTGGTVVPVCNEDSLFCLLEKAAFAVGMRLHFLLTAAIAGIPTVALPYDRKVESCLSPLSSGGVISAGRFTGEELYRAACTARADFSRQALEERVREQKKLSNINFSLVSSLLEGEREEYEARQKFFVDS
ncbi:MAG: polysaccharide pyruvyl transferase family protein [Clostridia bacterium]|nr:polysaccharide pyruvyl transferase family protein [Clostridia bacterium]